jgi:chromosome segregation and condensation protein ScpB
VAVDLSDVVRLILIAADEPLNVEQIVERGGSVLDPADVERSLEHWRKEGVAVEDVEHRWSWQGPR